MNWNININQRAIAELNEQLPNKLDLKDATILEWMLKFHAEPKSKKMVMGDVVYFWGAYALIIKENPLLEITNKERISRRIDKLIDGGLLYKYINKDKGNKTYFAITQKCFDLIKRSNYPLSTQKSIPIDSKVDTLSTQKSNNNNISNNIYIYNNEKIIENFRLLEILQRDTGKSKEFIITKIPEFEKWNAAAEIRHNNNSDLFIHFQRWFKSRNWDENRNVDKEIEWFMKMFNSVSRGDFVTTKIVSKYFAKCLSEGYTGVQMKTAVKNMYSSNDKNKWHKETGYLNATPEFLLKNDNLNKYLNQRY